MAGKSILFRSGWDTQGLPVPDNPKALSLAIELMQETPDGSFKVVSKWDFLSCECRRLPDASGAEVSMGVMTNDSRIAHLEDSDAFPASWRLAPI
jgi:hypothetical protein